MIAPIPRAPAGRSSTTTVGDGHQGCCGGSPLQAHIAPPPRGETCTGQSTLQIVCQWHRYILLVLDKPTQLLQVPNLTARKKKRFPAFSARVPTKPVLGCSDFSTSFAVWRWRCGCKWQTLKDLCRVGFRRRHVREIRHVACPAGRFRHLGSVAE